MKECTGESAQVRLAPFVLGETNIERYLALQRSISESAFAPYFQLTLSSEEVLVELTGKKAYWICLGTEVVGFIAHLERYDKTGAYGYIWELIISPQFQGKNLGKKALQSVLQNIYFCMRVRLQVDPHNTPALKTYLDSGFVIENWENNVTLSGRPRLIMLRSN